MKSKRVLAVVALTLAVGLGWAKDRWDDIRADGHDSMPFNVREYFKRRESKDWFLRPGPFAASSKLPDSQGLRLVGKWGRGPAVKVTGQDTVVFVSMGSEVAVFGVTDGHHPNVLAEIQCPNMVARSVLKDTLLYIAMLAEIDVYNVANPRQPRRISRTPMGLTDVCISDSLLFTISVDSLKIFSLANPESLRLVGACRDSGYNMFASDGFVYLCDRWGLYIVDATNPASPHHIGAVTGAQTGAVWVEDGLCYYTTAGASQSTFRVANVADPYHPSELGHIDGISGYDLYKLSFFVYLPGYQIVDVSQPGTPAVVGSESLGGSGVWTRSPYSYSFIASGAGGLASVDISDPVRPSMDTLVARADKSRDVRIDGAFAYVANGHRWMKDLSLTPVSTPREIGSYDTLGHGSEGQCLSKAGNFAYLMTFGWSPTDFRVVDVSDPAQPTLAATCAVWNSGTAIELRDSLAYVAEDYHFEIFSVANPRAPKLVGSCMLPNYSFGLCLKDSLASIGDGTALVIVNVARPAAPEIIGSRSMDAFGVDIRDSIAIVGGAVDVAAVSIADPSAPSVISTLTLGETCYGVAIDGSLAYVGASANAGCWIRVVDFSDPEFLHCVDFYRVPWTVRQVRFQNNLIYAACLDGGVCILETTGTVGTNEAAPVRQRVTGIELAPNPASSFVTIRKEVMPGTSNRFTLYNAEGRIVLDLPIEPARGQRFVSQVIDIGVLPDGCYFVSDGRMSQSRALKFVKTSRR